MQTLKRRFTAHAPLLLTIAATLTGCAQVGGAVVGALAERLVQGTTANYTVVHERDDFENAHVIRMSGNGQVTNYVSGVSAVVGSRGECIVENVNLIIRTFPDGEVRYGLEIYREHAGLNQYDDTPLQLRIGSYRADLTLVEQDREGGATREFLRTTSVSNIDSWCIYDFPTDPSQDIMIAEDGAYRYYASGDRVEMTLTDSQLANLKEFITMHDPRHSQTAN